ncbi:MAG TPA: biotin/lipoyl-binding carrier protein [Burkholderiaceae bacterium]|nr:biotin/lipoyl-binding carrier protein [Burkholderiaceae bacterium]
MAATELKAEVTGSVWKIITQTGQSLAAGDTVMILESMKMEIPVIAEDGGTLVEIRVAEGNPVTEGQVLALVRE